MDAPIATIIIPTYNHAAFLPAAIDCALGQTVPCEVIVVDDGSTDDTAAVLERYRDRITAVRIPHGGLAAARNAALDIASGEFVMFLDADDIVAEDKIARQLAAMTPEVGWVLCDVRIEDANGRVELASQRYDYATKGAQGWGWIQPFLSVGNFIPVHAPLVRRSVIGDIRFYEHRFPEDWHFWYDIAGVSKCRYVPEVLATYQKRPGSRNGGRWRGLQAWPGAESPLRLNLGCGTRGKPSWNPVRDFVNLDKSLGWRFEDGLRGFSNGSVSGITISHALMFVQEQDWPAVFAECARVLRPGGVLRVTEDDAKNPESSRFGGWKGSEPAITLTDAAFVRTHMEAVGLTVWDVDADSSRYVDGSLRQAHHGAPPDVFFIEGVRSAEVLFAPHADDEVLFAAFTLLQHRPRVVICYPSVRDYGDTAVRTAESRAAVATLGAGPVSQWQGGSVKDLIKSMRGLDRKTRPARVWAPSADASHPEHVMVAEAALAVFGDRLVQYQTYNEAGKVRVGDMVPFEPGWQALKRQALACYQSQIEHPRASAFFEWDLAEYVKC